MSVLDRLEREVRESRQRRERAAAEQAQASAQAAARAQPALERARDYLETLASHLNEHEQPIAARYAVDEIGELAGLEQQRYRVTVDDGAVRLRFECVGARALEKSVDGHPRAEAMARALRAQDLSCRLKPASERVTVLRVEPRVPVAVAFVREPGREDVNLELRNLPVLGVQRYLLAPERVDEPLLEAVAKRVLREPDELATLTGSVVDGEQRAELKREVERGRRRREAEVAGGIRRAVFPLAEWFRRRLLGG